GAWASSSRASDARVWTPSGMPSCVLCTEWYGPATNVAKYVAIGWADSIRQRPAPSRCAGPLPRTVHVGSHVTVNANGALRSGWSKQAIQGGAASRNDIAYR